MAGSALRRRATTLPSWLLVGAIWLMAAAFVAVFTTQITLWQADDLGYTRLAIALSGSIEPLLDPLGAGLGRLNQLYPLTLAPIYGLLDNTTAFQVAHVWNALLMTSAVIPAYLLACQVTSRRWAACLAAAIVGFSPWMTQATGLVTEIAAYPASVWGLLAVQRAVVAPSAGRDLIALLAIAVACFARVQLGVLVLVLLGAVVAHELLWAQAQRAERSRGEALRQGFAAIARGHRLLLAATAALTIIGGLSTASGRVSLGFYSNVLSGQLLPSGMLDVSLAYLGFMALGLGVVPVVMALAFTGAVLLRPEHRGRHALAIVGVLYVLLMTAIVASITQRFVVGVLQERYLMYVVPLLVIAFVTSFELPRQRLALAAVPASAAVVGLVLFTDYENPLTAFWFFNSPGLTLHLKVVGAALERLAAPYGLTASVAVLSATATAGVALALLALLRVASAATALAVSGAMVLAFSAVAAAYDFQQVVHGSSGGTGFGDGTVAGQDWVDAARPGVATVALLAPQRGTEATSQELFWNVEFWNRDIKRAYRLGNTNHTWHGNTEITVDRISGAVEAPEPTPWVVAPTGGLPLQLEGERVARAPEDDLELLRAEVPYRAALTVTGASDAGWLPLDGEAVTVRVRLRGDGGCRRLSLTVALPAGLAREEWLAIHGRDLRRRLVVAAGEDASATVRACAAPGERMAELTLTQGREAVHAGDPIGLRIIDIEAR